jgi:capsule polysaccharide export protein KpsE/RkpR
MGEKALSAQEIQNFDQSPDPFEMLHGQLDELPITIWKRRRFVFLFTGAGLLCTVLFSLTIPNEYLSTATLMIPEIQSLTGSSVLGPLTGQISVVGGTSGIFNSKSPGALLTTILGSNRIQDAIIARSNLMSVYHKKLSSDTRKALTANTTIDEDKKSGILTLTVKDRDKNRAQSMVREYIEELNRNLNDLNSSNAHREREFLEIRLKSIKSELDDDSRTLAQFSSNNVTLDYEKQGDVSLTAAARLQGELITSESELQELRAKYADDNVRIKGVQARIQELKGGLQKMGGKSKTGEETTAASDQLLPSIRQLPMLSLNYYNLYREVRIKEALYETLSKQYELAKVQEARELPVVKVIDEPDLAERKTSPHRVKMAISGTFLFFFLGIFWVALQATWFKIKTTPDLPLKAYFTKFKNESQNPA